MCEILFKTLGKHVLGIGSGGENRRIMTTGEYIYMAHVMVHAVMMGCPHLYPR